MKNADPDKYGTDGTLDKNVVIFGVENNSSTNTNKRKKIIISWWMSNRLVRWY